LYWHISTGETGIPAIGLTTDRHCLEGAFYRAAPAHRHPPDFGEHQEPIIWPCPILELWVGEGVVAVTPVKTGIAGYFALPEVLEKRLEGALCPQHHILQDLAVDFCIVSFQMDKYGHLTWFAFSAG
jgi:hypothetical protein